MSGISWAEIWDPNGAGNQKIKRNWKSQQDFVDKVVPFKLSEETHL